MPAKKVADVKTDKSDCMDAYCVRCKTKKTMVGGKNAQTKNGRWMCQGTCETCGGKMNKFISTPK